MIIIKSGFDNFRITIWTRMVIRLGKDLVMSFELILTQNNIIVNKLVHQKVVKYFLELNKYNFIKQVDCGGGSIM